MRKRPLDRLRFCEGLIAYGGIFRLLPFTEAMIHAYRYTIVTKMRPPPLFWAAGEKSLEKMLQNWARRAVETAATNFANLLLRFQLPVARQTDRA